MSNANNENTVSESTQIDRKHYGPTFPILLGALGAWTLYLSAQLPDFIQRGRQLPGPRYFPTILGIFFCVAAVVELVRYLRQRRNRTVPAPSIRQRAFAVMQDWGSHSVVLILASLIVFVPLIRYVGFIAGGIVFSALVMLRLRAKWYNAIILSVVVVLVIAVVFGMLFRVPLPRGAFGIAL